MEQFLNRLYSYEYFGTYLMISIVVLILLFIIILFFGKKDQRKREIEETKKLQQINNTDDTFKEETVENKVEIEAPIESLDTPLPLDNSLDNSVVVPTIENITEENNVTNNMEVLTNEEILNNNIEVNKEEIKEDIKEVPNEFNSITLDNPFENNVNNNESAPVLEKIEEKPIVFDSFTEIEEKPVIPEFNFDDLNKITEEEIKTPMEDAHQVEEIKTPEVFSSVFVDDKEEANNEPADDDLDFELPTLKKEFTEKKEEPMDMPNLNDLSGETYNINN